MNAQEAIALLKGVNLNEALDARHLGFKLYKKLADKDALVLAPAALWNAGRVQGIREERAKRRQDHEH